jgi:hypothetical protein
VRKIVMSSSPSTRFDGGDICGKAADELPIRCASACMDGHTHASTPLGVASHVVAEVAHDDGVPLPRPPGQFLQAYAETKAMGEARAEHALTRTQVHTQAQAHTYRMVSGTLTRCTRVWRYCCCAGGVPEGERRRQAAHRGHRAAPGTQGDAMRTCTAHMHATPHAADALLVLQVYGPRDMLFLHNILGAGNKVRIFGTVRSQAAHTHT